MEEGTHQQAELGIVALRLKENVIEVKRNPEKFNRTLLEDKQAGKNRTVLSGLSIDGM